MQEARRSLTTARLSRIVTLWVPSLASRGAFAALALVALVAIAAMSLVAAGQLPRAGQPGGSALVAAAGPAPDYASDYGTEFDPFVIQNSQRHYAPLAPAPDAASDLGTEFDPFVIENSRPRYAGSGQGAPYRVSPPGERDPAGP